MQAPSTEDIGAALALLVHDLRNPAATLSANTAFLRGSDLTSAADDPDFIEAMDDMGIAMRDLMNGFRHFGWLTRWLAGQSVGGFPDADCIKSLMVAKRESCASGKEMLPLTMGFPEGQLPARGGSALAVLAGVFLENTHRHARGRPVHWSLRRDADRVIFEHVDEGAAIAPELRAAAFRLDGQAQLKGRGDGRYGRCLALFSAGLIAETIGAIVEADGEDGNAIFRVSLAAFD